MRHKAVTLTLFLPGVLGAYALYRRPGATRAQRGQTACCGPQQTIAPRELDFPYYSLRDGFSSTLLLVSDSPKPLDFNLVVHSLSGNTVLAPPMTIGLQEKLSIDLRGLLTQLGADVTGAFAEGSVAIDLRKLRDAQKADFKGNRIPAGATNGSASFVRLDNVPVMGRLVVLERHRGLGSTYDCCTCGCPLNFTAAVSVSPSTFHLIAGLSMDCICNAQFQNCNGTLYWYNGTNLASWSSSNTSVCTMDGSVPGRVWGVVAGTATITAPSGGDKRRPYLCFAAYSNTSTAQGGMRCTIPNSICSGRTTRK